MLSALPVPFPSRKPPRPMSCNPVRPGSTAISADARRPSFSSPSVTRPLLLSLALPAGFFFFFGSATVPLAARESPLTRRMDDLRISSRSLSLVRSRYRRRLLSPLLWRVPRHHCLFPPQFSDSSFLFAGDGFLSPPSSHARVPPPYRNLIERPCLLCRDATRALTKESSARASFGVPANK